MSENPKAMEDRTETRVTRLAQARDWYLQMVDALPPDGWRKPTLCEGWTATHVVAHVTTGDQLTRGMVFDAIGKSRTGQDLPIDFPDRKRRFEAMLSWNPEQIKARAHKEAQETVAVILEAVESSAQAIVTMPVGQVPLTAVRALRLNEYIIHGHDQMPAIGRSIAIPDWFMDRAFGEAVGMMTRLHQRSAHKGKTASFHIHRTDGDGEWILKAADGLALVEPGHQKADVAMRGPAEGLYWVLMGRGKAQEHGVEMLGDPTLAAAFKEWFPGP
jgi:uncharacterized protein (TIGR03083 family)